MEPVKKVDQSGLKIHPNTIYRPTRKEKKKVNHRKSSYMFLTKDQISRVYNMILIIKRHGDLLMGSLKGNTLEKFYKLFKLI